MLKSYKFRIVPTKKQEIQLAKTFGACRWVYNTALMYKMLLYKEFGYNISKYELQALLVDWKVEFPWLAEAPYESLQISIHNVDYAYNMFFKGVCRYPKFKNKYSRQTYKDPYHRLMVDFDKSLLSVVKFTKSNVLKINIDRPFKGKIKNATISKTPTGKYYASILVDTQTELPQKPKVNISSAIGIDLGIKDFAILSDGTKIPNQKFLDKDLSHLKYLQRQHSKHPSKRSKRRLALHHEKIANKRKDHHHKLSSKLISENQTICIEDLNIKGLMARSKPKQDEQGNYLPNGAAAKSGLNRSIQDAGWSMFVEMLKYKAEWCGVNLIQIPRFAPSSKQCSKCGHKKQDLTLDIREWECETCHHVHDRDINAAKNIKQMGLITYCKQRSAGRSTEKFGGTAGIGRSVDPKAHSDNCVVQSMPMFTLLINKKRISLVK